MSDKTRAELKEQIKIMNHNYQVIREMHERGYRYSVSEIKRLQDELDRTRKALDVAIKALTSIMEHPEDIGDAMDAEDALNQIKQITEGPTKNAQKKMSPEELAELELLVNATFK